MSEQIVNSYGHPCVRVAYEVKGYQAVKLVELCRVEASKFPWYREDKQVLFKDGNGLNLDPENLTQDWNEVRAEGKKRPVIATVKGNPVVFDSIKTCANFLGLKPLYVSQALSRGTNIGGYFIEYYFGTLPEAPVVRGAEPVKKGRRHKVEVDGIPFYKFKDAADYLGVLPTTLSIYFKQGRTKIKGHEIKKL